MDSFGFSNFLTRGRNSVATKPGDIAYHTHIHIISSPCTRVVIKLTETLILDFKSLSSLRSPSVSAAMENFVAA